MRVLGLLLTAVLLSGCSAEPREVLRLDRGTLTVDNQTDEEWQNVEIWINNYYRAVTPAIAARGLFQVRLDSFVSGYARRFDYTNAQVTDLRLSARRPSGERLEIKKDFQGSPLEEAVKGKR